MKNMRRLPEELSGFSIQKLHDLYNAFNNILDIAGRALGLNAEDIRELVHGQDLVQDEIKKKEDESKSEK